MKQYQYGACIGHLPISFLDCKRNTARTCSVDRLDIFGDAHARNKVDSRCTAEIACVAVLAPEFTNFSFGIIVLALLFSHLGDLAVDGPRPKLSFLPAFLSRNQLFSDWARIE
jgi:hypothetical protein